jgi:nuclear pore complex protein Nup205
MQIFSSSYTGGGIQYDLEMVESKDGLYPETRAFIGLMNTLVYPNVDDTDFQSLLETSASIDSSIPAEMLTTNATGQAPAVVKYVTYLLQEVLLKIDARTFVHPNERWFIIDACLDFIERSIFSLDLSVVGDAELPYILAHPGYNILCRILAGSPLFAFLLRIVELVTAETASTKLMDSCVRRVMVTLNRVLEMQTEFLRRIVPAIRRSTDLAVKQLAFQGVLAGLDELLVRSKPIVIAMADMINGDDRLAWLSVRLMRSLSMSSYMASRDEIVNDGKLFRTYFANDNRLMNMLTNAPELGRIVNGYLNRMLSPAVGENDRNSIQAVIVELILSNLKLPAPSFAHLLLGYNINNPRDTKFGGDQEHQTVLTALLHLLPTSVATASSEQESAIWDCPFHVRQADLVENVLEIVYRLCTEPFTSAATMRYLRYGENLFCRLAASLDIQIYQSADGTEDVSIPAAQLRQRAWILKLIALEIHMSSLRGEQRYGRELVQILLGSAVGEPDENNALMTFGQDYPVVVDLFSAFINVAVPEIPSPPANTHFQTFKFSEYKIEAKSISDSFATFDLVQLKKGLLVHRQQAIQQGLIRSTSMLVDFDRESDELMAHYHYINHLTALITSRSLAFSSWAQLMQVITLKAFDSIPAASQQTIMFDVLETALEWYATSDVQDGVQGDYRALSKVVVVCFGKLRASRKRIDAANSEAAMPNEKMLSLTQQLIDVILADDLDFIARANLYGALMHCLAFVRHSDVPLGRHGNSDKADASVFSSGASTITESSPTRLLLKSTWNLIVKSLEQLVQIICGDIAKYDEKHWMTIALSTLSSLLQLERLADKQSRLTELLLRRNYLRQLAESLCSLDAFLSTAALDAGMPFKFVG